ncbi:hypothetical protein P4278_27160 [Bacillus thuringiensis]|nr:hypothetical protein [Bacillus thuringiensis]MED2755131.1 hypothetical protein [Bacillus thuringiensis]MED2769659.1 hypothetical protein [Bacillus thuringiensis]MED2772251.1 hypothetical protein [Bacillus thuringiensis]MED2783334.1 hypothetical protein [Bacillus thuringiensis]
MKNGKKTTKKEKMVIKSYNLNPENWLIFKKVDGDLHLIHRNTSAKRVISN